MNYRNNNTNVVAPIEANADFVVGQLGGEHDLSHAIWCAYHCILISARWEPERDRWPLPARPEILDAPVRWSMRLRSRPACEWLMGVLWVMVLEYRSRCKISHFVEVVYEYLRDLVRRDRFSIFTSSGAVSITYCQDHGQGVYQDVFLGRPPLVGATGMSMEEEWAAVDGFTKTARPETSQDRRRLALCGCCCAVVEVGDRPIGHGGGSPGA